MRILDDDEEHSPVDLNSYRGLVKWWLGHSWLFTISIVIFSLIHTYRIYQYNLEREELLSLTRGVYYFIYVQLFYYIVGGVGDSFFRWYTGSTSLSLPDKKLLYYFLFLVAILIFFLLEMDLALQNLFDDF